MSMFITFTWRPPVLSSRAYRQDDRRHLAAGRPVKRANARRRRRQVRSAEPRRRAPCQPDGSCRQDRAQPQLFVCRRGARICLPRAGSGAFAAKAVRHDCGRLAAPGCRPLRRASETRCGCAGKPRRLRASVRTELPWHVRPSIRCAAAAPAPRLRPKRCWRWPRPTCGDVTLVELVSWRLAR